MTIQLEKTDIKLKEKIRLLLRKQGKCGFQLTTDKTEVSSWPDDDFYKNL